jgi:transcription termination factor Rho
VSNTDLLSGDSTSADESEQAVTGRAPNGAPAPTPTRRRAGLSGMVLAELRELAGQLGIESTAGMRKGDLITAIKERQSSGSDQLPLGESSKPAAKSSQAEASAGQDGKSAKSGRPDKRRQAESAAEVADTNTESSPDTTGQGGAGEGAGGDNERQSDSPGSGRSRRRRSSRGGGGNNAETGTDTESGDGGQKDGGQKQGRDDSGNRGDGGRNEGNRGDGRSEGNRGNNRGDRNNSGGGDAGNRGSNNRNNNNDRNNNDDDDDENGRRRGRRFRDRRRGRGGSGGGGRAESDTEIREDDVLLPVAGILDVLENYAFVRTSGYLAGPNDVYVSLSLVRKYGLRRGDAITGAVRQPREGEQQRQKFNPLVRVDSINGAEPDEARKRPEFTKLTPLYPNDRLRLETEPHQLTTRVIDLVMPIGKGQRALIVSPPKAGKTSVLQSLANAITANNPECHLMVVLVDERPEEVTDMQRSVKGEVIASTFDRPPSDHTSVAELSIERAKRLVEMGNDVVVLLDSITRLGRAYNLAAPASGRILSGGVDSTALYPPKRFLGAARNIEGGGSLTIFATALVETGSTMDTVIFEEFKGTGNAELKLDRKIADKRVFPAIDVNPSGTRKEELLLAPDELAVNHKLRRVLAALDSQQAIDLLLDRLRKSRTNNEFLMQVSKTAPGTGDD